MTKAAQLWDVDKKRAFFRAYIRRETSLDAAAAEKLAEALTKAVNMMRVFEMPSLESAAPPPTVTVAATTKGKGKPAPVESAAAAPPAFDPYAFSAMVALARTGKDGLLKRLSEIKSAENLKAFAEAQHLGINAALKKPDELRKAIVAAAEQRLADRKAAAS
jgi:hypothetical protein